MKLNTRSLLLTASTVLATSSAMAWESAGGQYSTRARVALTSDYNIGVSKDLAGFNFDVRYYGTNKKLERQWGIGSGKDASDSFVFTISKSM